ncbi:acyltransferase [Ensifer sp. ENS07]|uniref:acyltransferase n=1 Tax=Ensifer sp. ENS07 TaxID=2769274 RepID=UPI001781B8C2|nr:acyltransferase [Ensifer sp. ENS07]MBD9641910.1 acyltransferase [Ensifer sp. ENS07]
MTDNQAFIFECAPGNDVQINETVNTKRACLKVSGKNNRIIIESGVVLSGGTIEIASDDNEVIIGKDARFKGKISSKSNGRNRLIIGERSTFGHVTIILAEGRTIDIGSDCMFSWSIEVRSTDSHPIFDGDTGERINHGKDIYVADHVWVGGKSFLMKGTSIPKGCVIGMGSLVTRAFEEERCVIAGNPARVIRSNVTWDREHLG